MSRKMSMQTAFLEFIRTSHGKELKNIKNDSVAFEYEFLAYISQNDIELDWQNNEERSKELLRIARSCGYIFNPIKEKDSKLEDLGEIVDSDDSEFVPVKKKEDSNVKTVANKSKKSKRVKLVTVHTHSSVGPSYRETYLTNKYNNERTSLGVLENINFSGINIFLILLVLVALFFMVKFLMLCLGNFFAELTVLKCVGMGVACVITYFLLKPRKKREDDENLKGMHGYMIKAGHIENWGIGAKLLIVLLVWFLVFCIQG